MFNNIIGNNKNKINLTKILESNNLSHSYIFSGMAGVGKFLFAKEFAKAILCNTPIDTKQKPCCTCKSCESIENNNNPDFIIIDEKEESIKTETIKKLANSVLEKPIYGKKKIYIINNSENMTKEAQNSLLKTLEEPPEYVIIILVTNNESLLLNTIKSRCIKISFKKLEDNEIKKYFELQKETLNEKLLKAFGGSIEKAINIKDKQETYEKAEELINNIESYNELQILNLKEELFKDKTQIYSLLDYINSLFYYKSIQNINKLTTYENCIEIIEDAKLRLKRNSNYDMTIDNCLLTIWEVLNVNGKYNRSKI